MNRRELAKNGFLGLCGALLGKLPVERSVRDTSASEITFTGPNGTTRHFAVDAGKIEPGIRSCGFSRTADTPWELAEPDIPGTGAKT